jgi:SAM-dependent methyltransferase
MKRFSKRGREVGQQLLARPINYNEFHAKRAASYSDLEGRKVLIVGCNRGKDCRYFVEFGAAEVHGLDVIEQVGQEYAHPKVSYVQESAEFMSFPNDMFDLVYCFATMEHIPRIENAFSEMVRVTKPGGFIYCVAAPLWESRFGHHKRNIFPDHPWIHLRMAKEEIIEFGMRHGLNSDGKLVHHVNYMLSDAYFNKTSAQVYVDVCANLVDMEPIVNTLALEADEVLSRELENELSMKGYKRAALLASAHTYVGRKQPSPCD